MNPPPCPGAMPVALAASLACTFEVMSAKAGNIHPGQPAAHASAIDFLMGGAAIAPVLAEVSHRGVGATILAAIERTRGVTRANPNLGVVLLLAPLAAVPDGVAWAAGIAQVLDGLTVADARAAYAAIRLAQPRGLGEVAEQDVFSEPTEGLTHVMRRAARYDLVARQYAEGFNEIFGFGHATLLHAIEAGGSLESAVVRLQLEWLARFGDTLIARLYGTETARAVALGAQVVLGSGWPDSLAGRAMFRDFDRWLRDPAQPKNPGAVADLVVACLFVALRSGTLKLPLEVPWSAPADRHANGEPPK